MRELVYFVAVSVDGYIAGPDDEFGDFVFDGDHMDAINAEFGETVPTHIAEQFGIVQDQGRFGTVLMGANTYGVGLPGAPSPYRHLEQIVFAHRVFDEAAAEGVEFCREAPAGRVRRLKAESTSGDIWLCGGADLAAQLAGEIDRLVLKRHPVLFGAGKPLFASAGPLAYAPERWARVRCAAFDSGVVVEEYVRRQD
ncbi:dihydrofolate reductase family protein [Dietzia sp.]|uniref:dihydrofolate reductase family protein n=1 Tax=Dietzia sp. TaxID=1871616 RepID=UPI002FDB70C0